MKQLVGDTVRSFARHGGTLLAGACAFFALLSAAPMLFIAITIAGAVTDRASARAELLRGLGAWLGPEGAATIGHLLAAGDIRPAGLWPSVASGLVLVYGSTRLFTQVQRALNHLWDVRARAPGDFRGKVLRQVERRILSFGLVLLCAAFLLASVGMRAFLERAEDVLGAHLSSRWLVLDHAGTFVVAAALFAALFKVLPDVRVDLRDAAAGALVTAALFHVGKLLLGVYLGHKDLAATFGPAGSVVMILLWVHYSAQIFFLGASFTAAWAKRSGRALEPTPGALRVRVEGEDA